MLYSLELYIQYHEVIEWYNAVRDGGNEQQKQESEAVAEGEEPQHRSNSNGAGVEASPERPTFIGPRVPLQVQAPPEARYDCRSSRTPSPEPMLLGAQGSHFFFPFYHPYYCFNLNF
jgi:hypothetical protein